MVTALARRTRTMLTTLTASVLTSLLLVLPGTTAGALLGDPPPPVKIIVQQWYPQDPGPAALVTSLGGTITASLPIVGGFAATVPSDALATIASSARVRAVTPDSLVLPQDLPVDGGNKSVYRKAIDAPAAGGTGPRGAGVTVAVVDTGISNVPDLSGRIKTVVNNAGLLASCVNFSTEPGCNDSYGHGTFIAGLIAGNGASSGGAYTGVAPAADVLAVKLSGRDGKSSVAQVLLAIQWVVDHKDAYDIGVLNLSLRVDSTLSYRLDPVNFAVEQAWASGLVVVVSAGNQGAGDRTIAKPGDDPWVITVGSTDDQGTEGLGDDVVSSFSSRGPTIADGLVKPDVVVPGRSLISLRSSGSDADLRYPNFVGDHYRRGSGTSFSAGIVSGAAAVLLSADPTMSNDRVKFALMSTARPLAAVPATAQGAGVVDVVAALSAPAGAANVDLFHPVLYPDAPALLADWEGSNWQGSNWQGIDWEGSNWQGSNWQGSNWQGIDWSGSNWQTFDWEGSNWQSLDWEGSNWQDSDWQGSNWQGSNWQGSNWQGSNWQGSNWQGSNWQSQYWS